jgi:mannose-6-phosphate isomerase-like protein (cupin superfamily)
MNISKENAEHYNWGNECDGWILVNNEKQSIIHERMPPNTCEVRHYHKESHQFFFVLSGIMIIEIEGKENELIVNEGIEVPAQSQHQVFNRSEKDVEFLVISQPNTKNDRYLMVTEMEC